MLGKWSITIVTALVTATVLIGATVLLAGGSTSSSADSAPPPLTSGMLTPPPLPRPQARQGSAQRTTAIGPEGVPLTRGAPLGPARSPRFGSSSGGVPCGSREQLAYHVHARVTLYVNGRQRSIPLGVGIGPPVGITRSAHGPFASRGSCFSFLHTHAADGVIHIEAPAQVTFKLGQFFDVWRQRLDRSHLGRSAGRVIAYVDGRRYRGDPRAIPLLKHTQIQLEVGRPVVRPVTISFPSGL